jgi:hypothetical protein
MIFPLKAPLKWLLSHFTQFRPEMPSEGVPESPMDCSERWESGMDCAIEEAIWFEPRQKANAAALISMSV